MQGVQTPLPVRAVIRKRYFVESLLGKGRSGAVYLVKDPHIKETRHKLFVLKAVNISNEQERNRSLRKAAQLRALQHGGLPRVYEVSHDDKSECLYLLMEYIDGESLENLLRNQPGQQFSWHEAMSMMVPIVATVSYLHQQHPLIIHGDIKPANIIALESGFIRSLLVDCSLTQESDSITAPDYSDRSSYKALEQYRGEAGVQSDIYGLGATFYTLLTGIRPANALSRMTLIDRLGVDPVTQANEVEASVPFHISEVIDRAMSLNADDRFSSVDEFWEAFWLSRNRFLPPADDAQLTLSWPPGLSKPAIEQQPARLATEKKLHIPRRWKLALPVMLLLLLLAFVAWIPFGRHLAAHTTPPTRVVTVSPTLSPPLQKLYPLVASAYQGTIFDVTANKRATITLSKIQQNAGRVTGYLNIDSQLLASGAFSGTIDSAKRLQFIVTDAAGNPLFFFEGVIQSSTSMGGNYYRCGQIQENQCIQASGDYGIWYVLSGTASSRDVLPGLSTV